MRIVSWNMNYSKRLPNLRSRAWAYLRDGLRADVALTQESVPPPDMEQCVFKAIHESQRHYRWGSAVVALTPGITVSERPRIPLAAWDWGERPDGSLPESHPGASAVADVKDSQGRLVFTAASLYGQWEMMGGDKMYEASGRVHRILSDLTSILARGKRDPIIIGGDFNLTTQGNGTPAATAAAVFVRMEACGLTDCITHTRASRAPLPGCQCLAGDGCSHVQTYRHGNKPDSTPVQLDYAFASKPLLPRLVACQVVDDEEAWGLSDHCPIVLEFS
jgi:exonuclease III